MGPSLLMRKPAAGFDYQPLIVTWVSDSAPAGSVSGRMAELLQSVQGTPGVASAAYLQGTQLDPVEVAADAGASSTTAEEQGMDAPWLGRAGEDFFDVMRPRLAQGRLFTHDDQAGSAAVAVVSRVVAHTLFADAAVGKRIRIGRGEALTIVGVIDDISLSGYQPEPTAALFVPMTTRIAGTEGFSMRQLWTRASGEVGPMMRVLAAGGAPRSRAHFYVSAPHSMASSMGEDLAGLRAVAELTLAIFGVALSLAALGIYGLVAYTAEMRSRELAIREALGATRVQVARLMLRGAMLQTMAGAAAGAMIAIMIVDYLNGFHMKLKTTGVATIVAFAVIALTVLLSSVGPLRMTWRRDLSHTLRV
jgi:putative ABC transport system permease protein